MANTTFRNLTWPDGQTNASGIRPIAYYVLKSWIKKYPTMSAAPATPEDEISYDGDIELITGQTVKTIYSTQGKGKVTYEGVGEKDGRMFTNKATLSYPDINDDSKVFAKKTANSNIIMWVPHFVAGGGVRFAQFGSENFPAEVNPKGDSGDAAGSAKATTIEVSAPDFLPLPNYTGVLPLEDGSLNCSTGVFTPTAP